MRKDPRGRRRRKRSGWRIAAFAAIAVVLAAGLAVLALLALDRFVRFDEFRGSPFDAVASRFPSELEMPLRPSLDPERPAPDGPPGGAPQMGEGEFMQALAALDRLRAPRRPPQPPNALLNDGQIASLKERLALGAEQEPYWDEMETALRGLVWEKQRNGAALDPESVERFKQAAQRFMPVLNGRQRAQVRLLASIGGLKLDQVE